MSASGVEYWNCVGSLIDPAKLMQIGLLMGVSRQDLRVPQRHRLHGPSLLIPHFHSARLFRHHPLYCPVHFPVPHLHPPQHSPPHSCHNTPQTNHPTTPPPHANKPHGHHPDDQPRHDLANPTFPHLSRHHPGTSLFPICGRRQQRRRPTDNHISKARNANHDPNTHRVAISIGCVTLRSLIAMGPVFIRTWSHTIAVYRVQHVTTIHYVKNENVSRLFVMPLKQRESKRPSGKTNDSFTTAIPGSDKNMKLIRSSGCGMIVGLACGSRALSFGPRA